MSINSLTKLLVLLLLPLLFTAVSCNRPTEPHAGNVTITVEDASCTEVWLAVNTGNTSLPENFVLYENNTRKKDITLTERETVIVIENLLPKQNYSYKLINSNNVSNETLATTLDTTSHNFTWQTFEFGQHSSSALYDVAIIDENNIWAVGEIYMNDSLGNPDHNAYNAVHWDGSEWKLKRIMFYTFCPQGTGSGSYPARSIFAFDNENIVISSGSQIAFLKNGTQTRRECLPVSVNKIWGISLNDYYIVGYGGGIAHWNGSSWKKIESGTTTNINDVWGIIDPITQVKKIFCAVSFVFTVGDYKILTISGSNNVDSLNWNTGRRVHTIWTKDGYRFFVGGGGVFTNKKQLWEEITELPLYYSRNIRGRNLNDIFVVGDFGWRAHFNGETWKVYEQLATQPDLLYSQQLTNNMLITVGERGNKAMIVVGRR